MNVSELFYIKGQNLHNKTVNENQNLAVMALLTLGATQN
jgi:hypothetical protein